MSTIEQFLKLQDVVSLTKIPKSTIYARAKAGTMPRPFKLSERSSAFRLSEIEEFMRDPLGWTPK